MSVEVIRNSRAAEEQQPSPVHEDGSRYPFAMRFDGGWSTGFADTPEELLGLLIGGYPEMSAQDQQVARIRLAIGAQVAVQAEINSQVSPEDWEALSDEEREVLNGNRVTQPHGWGEADGMGDVWDSEIPLVLVETGYAPYTDIDKPISGIADVLNPPNIIWLRPVDEWEFLQSLSAAGYVRLFETTDI